MTAGAMRDVKAKPSIITPIASSIAEAILPIMQYIGIKKLIAKKIEAANLKRIIADLEFFEGTPPEMIAFATTVKDQLAELIAAAGMNEVEITADKNEIDQLVSSYDQLRAMFEAAKISSEELELDAEKTSLRSEESHSTIKKAAKKVVKQAVKQAVKKAVTQRSTKRKPASKR